MRGAYSSKQGIVAGEALQANVRLRSEAAGAGSRAKHPISEKRAAGSVPEVGFKDGKVVHVDKYPGGSPAGVRTADLAIAMQSVRPDDWQDLVGKAGGGHSYRCQRHEAWSRSSSRTRAASRRRPVSNPRNCGQLHRA